MTVPTDWDAADPLDAVGAAAEAAWEGGAPGAEGAVAEASVHLPLRTLGTAAATAAAEAFGRAFSARRLFLDDALAVAGADGLHGAHRFVLAGAHDRDGPLGAATGRRLRVHAIAEWRAAGGAREAWVVLDTGGVARQLGQEPRDLARDLGRGIARSGAAPAWTWSGTPPNGAEASQLDEPWSRRYAEGLELIMAARFDHVLESYDRGVRAVYPGAREAIGRDAACEFWLGLRSAFPTARFTIHRRIGAEGGSMSPRAAIRWSLDGLHEGWGAFGRPTGRPVHVAGLSQAEFGPWGLRREWTLYDEVAVWTQILGDGVDGTGAGDSA